MRLDATAGDASDEDRHDAPVHDAIHEPAQDDGPREDGATPDEPAPPGALARAVASVRTHASLADALRPVGAALLVTSASRFLLAGVEVDRDLRRFALLLGQTALLTGAGFAVARLFDDARGARLLFALALLSVPAGFAVLGAMAYSLAPIDPASLPAPSSWPTEGAGPPDARDLPAFARWRAARRSGSASRPCSRARSCSCRCATRRGRGCSCWAAGSARRSCCAGCRQTTRHFAPSRPGSRGCCPSRRRS